MRHSDKLVVAGVLAFSVLAGLWAQFMGLEPAADAFIDFLTFAAVAGGLVFIYEARDELGGETARNLEILGIGLLVFVLAYWPSYTWSTVGSPEWLGMTTGFWSMLFGLANFVGLAIVTYAFYTFWEMAQ
ncbi:hypothetical protein AQV86_02090 [Nanohaloarchaea archaeon SG9]|nr:hypothetical protein AQV86_02090 [Nanohaloarchaea archaeon SG9]